MHKCVTLLLLLATLVPAMLHPQTHRIGIRTLNHRAEFFDRITKKKFVPRGNNYIRLAHLEKLTGGEFMYHSTFNPGLYDTAAIAKALREMAQDKYNVVRVFLNYASVNGIGGKGGSLSSAYMSNVVDFLRRSKSNKITVMFTIDWLPVPQRVVAVESLWCPDFQCTNVQILTTEGLRANERFFTEFVKDLKRRKAPIDAIFAYELRNELTFDPQLPPLSLSSGTVKAANGKTYDLSSREQKRGMLDEGLVYWIDHMRKVIRSLDRTALVTVGFIPPKDTATSLREQKLSITAPAFLTSTLDFIDVHIYPIADGATLQEFVDRFGLKGALQKPVVIGELGAIRQCFPSVESAAHVLRTWQTASAKMGFSGWLLWAWDLHEDTTIYSAEDNRGIIDRALAPMNRPDVTAPDSTDVMAENVARGGSVTASNQVLGQPASNAIDGSSIPWNSGDFAPQWIEIDLHKPTAMRKIRLIVSQSPPGPTLHQIWVRTAEEQYRLLREIRGETHDFQILEYDAPGISDVRFIKIVTTKSPSWVGWREIEILK
jgi:F5/8 type C domain